MFFSIYFFSIGIASISTVLRLVNIGTTLTVDKEFAGEWGRVARICANKRPNTMTQARRQNVFIYSYIMRRLSVDCTLSDDSANSRSQCLQGKQLFNFTELLSPETMLGCQTDSGTADLTSESCTKQYDDAKDKLACVLRTDKLAVDNSVDWTALEKAVSKLNSPPFYNALKQCQGTELDWITACLGPAAARQFVLKSALDDARALQTS